VGAQDRFDAIYQAVSSSATHWNIQRDIYGPQFPEDAAPYSFVTLADLERIATAVAISPGQSLVDVGCPRDEPQPSDHQTLLREAGFVVEAYEPDQEFEVHFRALVERYQAQRAACKRSWASSAAIACWRITSSASRCFAAGDGRRHAPMRAVYLRRGGSVDTDDPAGGAHELRGNERDLPAPVPTSSTFMPAPMPASWRRRRVALS
jgi:hypothetical protein